MDTSERITVETPKPITRRRRSAGLSKLRTNAFASEHNLPPDAYRDQDNEQIPKKRKINTSSKSKHCSLAWVRGKSRARMEKHQQHTNQDWNRGENEHPFTSPLAQTAVHTRKRCPSGQTTSEGSYKRGRTPGAKNDKPNWARKCVRISPTDDTDPFPIAKTPSDTSRASTLPRNSTIAAATNQIAPYGLTHGLVEILRLAAFCLARLMPHYQAKLKVDRTGSLSQKSPYRLAAAA
jgi:hypothetical protein